MMFRAASRRAFCSSGAEFSASKLTGADAGITVLTMNRPASRNALGRDMMKQFAATLDEIRFDKETRVVVLRSTVDRVFCAGADLKERATMDPQEVSSFVFGLRTSFAALEGLPMPTIAAVEGAALGGGLELAMACDLRVAGEKALLGLPETALAIIPGAGGTQRLPRLVGAAKAKELVFTARRFGAEDAKDMGLVNRVAPAGEAYDSALELAREILPQGPVALRVAKVAISQGVEMDKTSGMKLEEQCYAQVIPTKDRIEGLTAFREKRKPVYTGE